VRIGLRLEHGGGFLAAARELPRLERAGLDTVYVSELYSFDAVSQLGYLAAVTERVRLVSGILPLYSRTPTLIAMTAAGLDYVSGGRFTLGLGASGPQVIEGFHAVPHDSALLRTQETIEICRKVWRREVLVHEGDAYRIPLPPDEGTGLGKPLKLLDRPVRERVPIVLAALGPKNVELAARAAEGWLPIFLDPDKAREVFGTALAAGAARRAPELGGLEIHADVPACFGEGADEAEAVAAVRARLALYLGGMGARGRNYYNHLACRYGYEADAKLVQDLYLDGDKDAAAAAVPESLVYAVSLIGGRSRLAERIAAYAEAGVTALSLSPVGRAAADPAARLRLVEELAQLAQDL
jgi:F420-dependent oxidoreductase-like protein